MYRQIIKKVIKPQNTIADIYRLSSSSGYYKSNEYESLYSTWSKKQLKNYKNQVIGIMDELRKEIKTINSYLEKI